MNARVLVSCVLLAAGCGGADDTPSPSPSLPPTTMAMAPSPGGPTVTAEVVTVDTAAPSITLREGDVTATGSPRPGDLKSGDRTIRVETTAATMLASLKPGDRVSVTCSSMPMASPGMMSPGMMSPGTMASPGMMSPGTMGTMGGLAQCDSIVTITTMGTTGS